MLWEWALVKMARNINVCKLEDIAYTNTSSLYFNSLHVVSPCGSVQQRESQHRYIIMQTKLFDNQLHFKAGNSYDSMLGIANRQNIEYAALSISQYINLGVSLGVMKQSYSYSEKHVTILLM